jgi:hypothetical protein
MRQCSRAENLSSPKATRPNRAFLEPRLVPLAKLPETEMTDRSKPPRTLKGTRFDPAAFFTTPAKGRLVSTHQKRQIIFAQATPVSDGGSKAELRHQVPINATPEKVCAALTTQAGLHGWWTADTTANAKVGGEVEFGFDKPQTVFRMKIEKLEPGKHVIWNCHGDQPEWNGMEPY